MYAERIIVTVLSDIVIRSNWGVNDICLISFFKNPSNNSTCSLYLKLSVKRLQMNSSSTKGKEVEPYSSIASEGSQRTTTERRFMYFICQRSALRMTSRCVAVLTDWLHSNKLSAVPIQYMPIQNGPIACCCLISVFSRTHSGSREKRAGADFTGKICRQPGPWEPRQKAPNSCRFIMTFRW